MSSVFRWWEAYRKKGLKELRAKPTPGRPPQLSPRQKQQLVNLLLQGPLAAGDPTALWTSRRVAKLIAREFEVAYHPCHGWKLLTGLGWSCQKPERRAWERDAAAIARWKHKEWPQIEKTGRPGGPSRLRGRKRLPPHPDRP